MDAGLGFGDGQHLRHLGSRTRPVQSRKSYPAEPTASAAIASSSPVVRFDAEAIERAGRIGDIERRDLPAEMQRGGQQREQRQRIGPPQPEGRAPQQQRDQIEERHAAGARAAPAPARTI